jgi:hypothetical protein
VAALPAKLEDAAEAAKRGALVADKLEEGAAEAAKRGALVADKLEEGAAEADLGSDNFPALGWRMRVAAPTLGSSSFFELFPNSGILSLLIHHKINESVDLQ